MTSPIAQMPSIVGAIMPIGLHASVFVLRDTDFRKAKTRRIRTSACCHENRIDLRSFLLL